MKFYIKDRTGLRLKLKLSKKYFSYDESILLTEYLKTYKSINSVKLYDRIGELKIVFNDSRYICDILSELKEFTYDQLISFKPAPENIKRIEDINKIKYVIAKSVVFRYVARLIFPRPLMIARTLYKMSYFIKKAIDSLSARKIDVSLLDATAITISVLRRDFSTANSTIFLLTIGELLEEYTHKKAVEQLSRSLSINIDTVWCLKDGIEVEIPFDKISVGDKLVVSTGNMIPYDGKVIDGIAMVNQASLTGESIAVEKNIDSVVYASTVVEDGRLIYEVTTTSGNNRIDEVVKLIEDSEKNKSMTQIKAYNISDKMVHYSFAGFALTYLLTRNITRALSFLMVDYSCAIKLCTPIAIMSAMKECGDKGILVKGGKYLESMANADTIVFDKTGTLTKSTPIVKDILAINGYNVVEVLRTAACLEEHFPHSLANAVVRKAKESGVKHEEMHGEVKYVVAHGIASVIDGKKAVIGSHHFIFEDEGVTKTDQIKKIINELPQGYTYLYLAVANDLAGIIVIEDPIKDDAKDVIKRLRENGFSKIVMLTGDNHNTAKTIADELNIDEYVANVLPSDKSDYINKLKNNGNTVVMVGDGVNDSPALSLADVGIAMASGSDIAKEISDVVIKEDNLDDIVFLKQLSIKLKSRIYTTYSTIVGYNTSLIVLGLFNIIMPGSSAFLHNIGTVAVAANSMKRLMNNGIDEQQDFENCKCDA